MFSHMRLARVTALAAVVSAAMVPSFALAAGPECNGKACDDVPGKECQKGNHVGNPHCVGPEVPITVVYPALGAATFAWMLYRNRRREGDPGSATA